jgi:hypothetical protein
MNSLIAHRYFFQSNHTNVPRRDMDDGEDMDGIPDEPMNEDNDEGVDGEELEEGEVEEEGDTNPAEGEGGGEAEDDSASVDSAYDRVLVEGIPLRSPSRFFNLS